MIIRTIALIAFCASLLWSANPCAAKSIYPAKPSEKPYLYSEIDLKGKETEARSELLNAEMSTSVDFEAALLNTIPKNMTPETYAAGLFKEWKVGHDDNGRGVLLLFVKNTNTLKIEVGYALEHIYTDFFCSSIQPMVKSCYRDDSPALIFSTILLNMELKLTDKKTKNLTPVTPLPPKPDKDTEWIYLSGGAGIVDKDYFKDKRSKLKVIQKISADKIKEFSADKDPNVVIDRFLKAYREGINYPFLDILLEGSQMDRLVNVLAPEAIRHLYDHFAENLPYSVTTRDDLAVAEFKGKRVPPILLRRDPAGLWRVDYAKSAAFVNGFGQREQLQTYHNFWSFGIKDRDVHLFYGHPPKLIPFPLNLKEKINRLNALIAKEPNNPDNYFQLADIYHWECAWNEEAAKVLEQGLKLEPDNVPYHISVIELYGKDVPGMDKIGGHYETILKYRPDDRRIYAGYFDYLVSTATDYKKINNTVNFIESLEKRYIGNNAYSRRMRAMAETFYWNHVINKKPLFDRVKSYYSAFGKLPSFSVMFLELVIEVAYGLDDPFQENGSWKTIFNKRDFSPMEPHKRWAMAANAVFSELHQDTDIDSLAITDDPKVIEIAKGDLSGSWDIVDKKSFYSTLQWLDTKGHRFEFDTIAQALKSGTNENDLSRKYGDKKVLVTKEYYKELGSKSILGWDYLRYIQLCRCAYTVGYITENEAWDLILPAAKKLHAAFDSWRDLADNYIIGRTFWDYDQCKKRGKDMTTTLLRLATDPTSPWNRYSWDIDFN